MKSIQLCGFGNGLVDLQFEVTDELINKLGLAKGQMILADSVKQQALLESLKSKKHNKCSGGSAANSIIAFSKFGGKGAYMSSLGDDDFGSFYSSEFMDLGISLKTVVHKGEPTGTSIVLITPDSERTMHTSLGASDYFGAEHIDPEIISQSEWLYLEGYKFSSDDGAKACKKAMDYAMKSDTKIALTFSDVFIIDFFRERVEAVLKNSDLIFCNEAEAKAFTKKDHPDDAFFHLSDICPNVAMTLGSKGSKVKWDSKVYDIKPFETNAVDSTGAGDMYAGAFFYGILETGSAETAGMLASLSASRVVSQMGARLNENHIDLFRKLT